MVPFTSRKFTAGTLARLQGLEPDAAPAGPTVRGWLLGCLSCLLLALTVPYIDMVIRLTRLTLNPLPASSMFLVFVFVVGFNLWLGRRKAFLRLTPQDLALIFSMTMLTNALPGNGLLNWVVNAEMNLSASARPENRWEEFLFPQVPEELAPRDPLRLDPPVRVCAGTDMGGIFDPEGAPRTAAKDGSRKGAGTLTGARLAVDGVTLARGDRVLLAGQTEAAQNGVYTVEDPETGLLARSGDADSELRVRRGLYVLVNEGRAHHGRGYILTTPSPVTLNRTPLHFEMFQDESDLPRAAEWFYAGLPLRQSESWLTKFRKIPWAVLAGPYLRWCVAVAFVLGLFFAVSLLLQEHWTQRERLPFPLAQVPDTLAGGLAADGSVTEKSFFRDRLAWWGVGLALALHSYNALGDYVGAQWAPIPLRNELSRYLTEPPYRHLTPLYICWYPSIIGLMYLVSLEVSFSLWFFYAVGFKLVLLTLILGWAMGDNGWGGPGVDVLAHWGHGALFAMVFAGLFLSRGHLWGSLQQALRPRPDGGRGGALSPRALWLFLVFSYCGAAGWLVWYGVDWKWAALAALLLPLTAIGVARLVCETGVVSVQAGGPNYLLGIVLSPATLGTHDTILLQMWSGVMAFGGFRLAPLTTLMSSLHLSTLARLRLRPLLAGLAVALVIVLGAGFFSYHYTLYTAPGGARGRGWSFDRDPTGYTTLALTAARLERYQENVRSAAEQHRPLASSEIPPEARTDVKALAWMGVGAGVMLLFVFLRNRLFWWPHAVGMVMWMSIYPMHILWFSYFVGWLVKWLITKFGGQRVFVRWRRFFVGLIIGEAVATILWIIVAWLSGLENGQVKLEYN